MSSRNTPRAVTSHLCASLKEREILCREGLLASSHWDTPAPEQAVKHAVLMLLHRLHMRSRLMCAADRNDEWPNQKPTGWPWSRLSLLWVTMFQPSSENHMEGLLVTFTPKYQEELLALMSSYFKWSSVLQVQLISQTKRETYFQPLSALYTLWTLLN